jgi:hypothetical protein
LTSNFLSSEAIIEKYTLYSLLLTIKFCAILMIMSFSKLLALEKQLNYLLIVIIRAEFYNNFWLLPEIIEFITNNLMTYRDSFLQKSY